MTGASADRLQARLRLARTGFALDVNLDVAAQGVTVVWGASGSGKTTLLRCIAGLERACGRVAIGAEVWQDDAGTASAALFKPVWQRRLGYVFQEASLFDHLNVAGNLRYGLRRSATPQDDSALQRAIDVLGISHLLDRRPATLSGGERQRVAIARALAAQPRLLLLDEPLAALDAARKREVLPWLERLRAQWQVPMVYVTHAADEVERLADALVVLEQGQVRASGAVQDVLASVEVPITLGDDVGALLVGTLAERDPTWGLVRVAVPGGDVWVADPDRDRHRAGGDPPSAVLGQPMRLRVLARDASITLQRSAGTSIQNHLRGQVAAIKPAMAPHQVLVRVDCGGGAVLARLTARAAHQLQLSPGLPVWVQIKSASLAN